MEKSWGGGVGGGGVDNTVLVLVEELGFFSKNCVDNTVPVVVERSVREWGAGGNKTVLTILFL